MLKMIEKSLTILGMCIALTGLTWFAHFSFSLKSYVFSAISMGVGVLVAFVGSTRRQDILFSIRRYFRRR
jgi:hypothetical protein